MKNIVITGSTRGVGLCMAKQFMDSGCNVTLSGRGENLSDETVAELGKYKKQFFYIPCNVTVQSDLEKLWLQSFEKWGKVDIWINNAGRNTPYELCFDTQPSYVEAVLDTNIKGMIYGSQVAAKNMLRQGFGAIWNMEGLGSNNMIQSKTILYGTTKHALTYFTKGLAKELEGTPITCGRLSPGMMLTDFITKSADGAQPAIESNKSFQKIFNLLADRPETVAEFLVPGMLKNTKNNAHIVWLTKGKSMSRFMAAPFNKRKLV